MRQRLVIENNDGTRLDMIADSGFVNLLDDFEKVVQYGEEYTDEVCRGLCRNPRYVRAFEHMLEREEDPMRRNIIERILLDYEFLTAFNLTDENG